MLFAALSVLIINLCLQKRKGLVSKFDFLSYLVTSVLKILGEQKSCDLELVNKCNQGKVTKKHRVGGHVPFLRLSSMKDVLACVCLCLFLNPLGWAHSLWRLLEPQLKLLFRI